MNDHHKFNDENINFKELEEQFLLKMQLKESCNSKSMSESLPGSKSCDIELN
jgi:hypothetical protein